MDREADDREYRGDEEAVDLDLQEVPEDREDAEHNRGVVEKCDDGRDAVAERGPPEIPESPRDEQHDEEARESDRLDRVLDELRRERRAHDRGVRNFRIGTKSRLQVLFSRRELRRKHLGRTHFDPAARDTLDGRLVMAVRGEERLHLGIVGSSGERELEERAALELDAGPQAADGEEEHTRHDEQCREEEVPPLALDEVE